MTTTPTVDDVATIADLRERVEVASELWREAKAEMVALRETRNQAGLIAHLDHGMTAVSVYRDLMGLTRGMFKRYLDDAPNEGARKRLMRSYPEQYGTREACETTLRDTVEQINALQDKVDRYAQIRDRAALSLMAGRDADGDRITPVSNADIARLTGLTTARIAQLRRGKC